MENIMYSNHSGIVVYNMVNFKRSHVPVNGLRMFGRSENSMFNESTILFYHKICINRIGKNKQHVIIICARARTRTDTQNTIHKRKTTTTKITK